MNRAQAILFIFCMIGSELSFSQHAALKFDRLSTENALMVKGLSQNSINCIMQDSKGFIWIGTWDGLNKYDGYNFTIYNTTNGLSNPTINALLEDDEKNIWIGTDDGLNFMDPHSFQIEHFYHAPDNPNSLTDDFINHIYQDKRGFIWISTAYGLNKYDKNRKYFTAYNFFERNSDSVNSNFITRVKEDENGMIWIATHAGIHCYNSDDQSFQDYKLEPDLTSDMYIRANYIQDLALDENGNVFAASLNGIYKIRPGYGTFHHLKVENDGERGLSGNHVNVLCIDVKGMVWIGTTQGLDLYDPYLNIITGFKPGSNKTSLSNEDVRSIYNDQAGTIWIGTYKGLNKVDPNPSRFTQFKNDPENPNSLSDNIVYAILEDKMGQVWIGTYGGVNILDRATEKFSFIRNGNIDPAGLSGNKIRTLALDSAGSIWIGTENEGMNRLDLKTGKITIYRNDMHDSTSISENNILSTMTDHEGRVWIGTVNNGIDILNPADGIYERLTNSPLSKVRLSDNTIWSVYEDRQGNFWVGTNEGLNKISPGLESVVIYAHNPLDPLSISSNRVFSIFQDREGIFWIGTMGAGLNRFDPVAGEFRTYNERHGLPNNVVYATMEDDEGNLWISSNGGLSKFNKLNETFINYDTKDGVQGNEFNAGAYFKNKNGEMYFGGMNGFNVFHPSEISINKVPPRIVFTNFRILNEISYRDLEDGEIIRLSYNENFFSVEFSALDYTNPPKNLYRYRLENYDNDWIVATADQRKAEYRKVAYGTYRFRVTGSNNDGVWNKEGISLTIIIKPPWWQTWYFRLAAALLLITALWSAILLRIKSIRRKHDVEKKMLSIEKQVFELEQKALRLQMNPHFIFNSLNAIQNFVLANDTDKAVNYLAKFSHLMRMILANSTASLITLKDELKALTYYIDLEKLRFDDKFEYMITRDPSIDEEFVEIPPLLFQPYVENAIIHGLVNSSRPGLLEISLNKLGRGALLCVIKDNGIGREKAIEIRNKSGIKRQPKGMIITQERIDIFNKQSNKNFNVRIIDLKDRNGEATGTQVEFTIQYKEI